MFKAPTPCEVAVMPLLLKLSAWQTTVEELMRAEADSIANAFDLDGRLASMGVRRRFQAFMLKST